MSTYNSKIKTSQEYLARELAKEAKELVQKGDWDYSKDNFDPIATERKYWFGEDSWFWKTDGSQKPTLDKVATIIVDGKRTDVKGLLNALDKFKK